MKFCPGCGNEISDTGKYCLHCGMVIKDKKKNHSYFPTKKNPLKDYSSPISGSLLANERFSVFEQIGEDGMGRVFKALDNSLDEIIALKMQPDIICLDLMMPSMDGFEAAEFLLNNQITKNIPIFMLTCDEDKAYHSYSKDIGIICYITKPFDNVE